MTPLETTPAKSERTAPESDNCDGKFPPSDPWGTDFFGDAWSYWRDAYERTVLFWDTMRQRGNDYLDYTAKTTPHVLKFDFELIVDGRKLPRPVNYGLVRIVPPDDIPMDAKKRPFVIVDPRAGHGPGIGGFKTQSEIGVALKSGHACYYIGFLPNPVKGQTIEDIMSAEAVFLERVIELHPKTDDKPAVIGNCQAGWAMMMLAAIRPELFGPLMVAGSPLSYWAGVRGQNPMRYTGGLLGGSWLTALMGDLGDGKFDGAWLVANFENLNPANTFWSKPYGLYSKVDTEAPRYLGFEQWWGGHVLLNAEEMQFIVDELFVGNKLATGQIVMSDGVRVDLHNVRSPIVVFCSKGDNITPPQQALGWILDLYESVADIRAHGQTIVYAVHETVGHLGIFVSGSVAKKEHDEFTSNMDLIDILPPGLYEAVMTPKDPSDRSADLIGGDYLVRFEARDLDDIRSFGGNDLEDDREFSAAARISEINLGLYRSYLQPFVQTMTTAAGADWMRRLHPLRLQYELFSDLNPFMRTISALADDVRETRHPAEQDNRMTKAEAAVSDRIEQALETYGEVRDRASEMLFHSIYGSQFLQTFVGLGSDDATARRNPGEEVAHKTEVARKIQTLKARVDEGGPLEAGIRALLYVRMPEGAVDERSLAVIRRIRDEHGGGLALPVFKQVVRDQFFMLLLDENHAVGAIPAMLAKDENGAVAAGRALARVVEAVGLESEISKARLAEVLAMFEAASRSLTHGKRQSDATVSAHPTAAPVRTKTPKLPAA